MNLVLPILGAIVGASLASDARWLFGALLGALIASVLHQLAQLRTQVRVLERQVRERDARSVATRDGFPEPVQSSSATASPVPTAPATPDPAPARGQAPASAWTPAPASAAQPGESAARQADERAAAARPADAHRSAPLRQEPPLVRWIRDYFTGGNTLVRVGIVILFFGVAFLLRYVAEHTRMPIEFRLTGVAAAAIVLLVLGWRLRIKRAGYALALQGGAIGILYLTVFAALKIYGVMSPVLAFPLLVLIAAFSAVLAIVQNSLAFALLGVTGGFLAPILASTGQGNHVVLFSYYAVLNAGILAVAWFKAWRPLNLAGFVFTFAIGTAWGVLRYEPSFFATSEPFLILFFLFYVAIAILFALRQPPQLRGYVDGTLVFGAPIVAFGLQAGMLHDERFVLAYSALAVSALYLLLAWLLNRSDKESLRLLTEAFMALGVAFLTLAIPLALDGRWSAATWALEGAALVWIGCRQARRLPRAFGALLQIAAGLMFWRDANVPYAAIPILNSAYLGGVMVSVAAIFSARTLHVARDRLSAHEAPFAAILFIWGLIWWLYCGLVEIDRRVPHPYGMTAALTFVAVTSLLSGMVQRRHALELARIPALALIVAMLAFAIQAVVGSDHPAAHGGWLAWPLAFGILYLNLRRHEAGAGAGIVTALHVSAAWLIAGLLSWEVAWGADRAVAGSGSWPAIAWALVPGVMLFGLTKLQTAPPAQAWPLGVHRKTYGLIVAAGLAIFLGVWSLITNTTLRGDSAPLPYVPILNPLDLAQIFVILVLMRFAMQLPGSRANPYRVLSAVAFVWLNAALLRALHHWAGVPFALDHMLRSTLVQTSLSIFWTTLALATMLVATRRGNRIVWLTGAGLLIVVIAKLFLVDLSRIGSVERIVSFVGVGLLMLVIGYFSPLPPAKTQEGA